MLKINGKAAKSTNFKILLLTNLIKHFSEVDLRLLQHRLPAVNYYHRALHLGCCSSPRSASASHYHYTYLYLKFMWRFYKKNWKFLYGFKCRWYPIFGSADIVIFLKSYFIIQSSHTDVTLIIVAVFTENLNTFVVCMITFGIRIYQVIDVYIVSSNLQRISVSTVKNLNDNILHKKNIFTTVVYYRIPVLKKYIHEMIFWFSLRGYNLDLLAIPATKVSLKKLSEINLASAFTGFSFVPKTNRFVRAPSSTWTMSERLLMKISAIMKIRSR